MLFIKFQNSRRLLLRRRQKDLDSSLGRACLRTRTQPPSRTRAATRHEAPPGRAGLPPHTSRLPAGTTLNWTAPGPPALHSHAQPGTGALGMGHGGSGPPGGVLRGCPPPTHPRVPACCLLGAETACGPGVSRWWVSTLTQVAPGQPELGPTGWGTGPKQPHCCLSFPDHDVRLAFLALTKD